MSEVRYLFLADDQAEDHCFWQGQLHVWQDEAFKELHPYPQLSQETRQALLDKAGGLAADGATVCLITDARFEFEDDNVKRFGGDRLAKQFLKDRSEECRAVIYSEEPAVEGEAHPRVWAVTRTRTPDQIRAFLVNGVRPQVVECLEFLRRMACFRPALEFAIEHRSVGILNDTLAGLAKGFGETVPIPFSQASQVLFDNAVAAFVRPRLGAEREAEEEWKRLCRIVHPYDALATAASDEFVRPYDQGGAFFALWQMSVCGRDPALLSAEVTPDELSFRPREREWIRRKRVEMVQRLLVLFGSQATQEEWTVLLEASRNELADIEEIVAAIDETLNEPL